MLWVIRVRFLATAWPAMSTSYRTYREFPAAPRTAQDFGRAIGVSILNQDKSSTSNASLSIKPIVLLVCSPLNAPKYNSCITMAGSPISSGSALA